MKVIDEKLLNEVSEQAKSSPRLRMNYDLRTQAFDENPDWKDTSQRMLNVMMKETVIPVHRHTETSETVIVLRGSGDEVTYNDFGEKTERVTLAADSGCRAVQVSRNVYHTFVPHEDGTVIFEAKDRAYDPVGTEEFTDPRE